MISREKHRNTHGFSCDLQGATKIRRLKRVPPWLSQSRPRKTRKNSCEHGTAHGPLALCSAPCEKSRKMRRKTVRKPTQKYTFFRPLPFFGMTAAEDVRVEARCADRSRPKIGGLRSEGGGYRGELWKNHGFNLLKLAMASSSSLPTRRFG